MNHLKNVYDKFIRGQPLNKSDKTLSHSLPVYFLCLFEEHFTISKGSKRGKKKLIMAKMSKRNISGNHHTSKEYFTSICIATSDCSEFID